MIILLTGYTGFVGSSLLEFFQNKDKIILLYFGAKWCGPCKNLKDNFKNDDLMNHSSSPLGTHEPPHHVCLEYL